MMISKAGLLTKLNFLILLTFPVIFILGKSFVNLAVILLTFSCIILFLYNKINPFSKIENILFSIFFTYIFINTLINYSEFDNTLKSIALFRYIFFSTAIAYTLNNVSIEQLKKIKYFYSFIIFFVIIDIIFQYYFGFDIFGFKPGMCREEQCERYQGPFGKELIAGSFFAYFGLITTLFFFNGKILNLFFLILGIAILITGDRSPFVAYIIFFVTYIIIFNQKFWKKIILIFVSFIIFFFVLNLFNSTKTRYYDFAKDITYSGIKKNETSKNVKDFLKEAKDSPWGKHYQVAWAMFLDKPINGHGYNSFQIKCKKYEEITNTNTGKFRGCSTHPHNAFLEILAEQGLIGFLILNVIIFYILNKILTLKFKNKKMKIKFILSGVLFLCFYFPFKPTGSLFSVWLGSITFFVYSFYLFFLDKNKSNNS
jgi:O-antigen ligase